jgi:hypothetical protein
VVFGGWLKTFKGFWYFKKRRKQAASSQKKGFGLQTFFYLILDA